MNELVCKACGSREMNVQGRRYVCVYCGAMYERQNAVPQAASIDKSSALADTLKRADLYWRHGKKEQARSLYRIVLEQDASCQIARERL